MIRFIFGQMACAPRGPEAELVFSLSWFSCWWRGAVFFLLVKWLALRAGQSAGLVFFFELVLALVAREMFFLLVKWLALRAGQR